MSTTLSRTFARQHCGLALLREPRLLVAFLCSVVLFSSGCVVTQSIDPRSVSTADVQEALEPGEPVRLILRDGSARDLDFTQWSAEHFIGQDPSDSQQRIPWQDISELQVERVSGVRTTLLVLTVAGMLVGIVVAIGESAYGIPL